MRKHARKIVSRIIYTIIILVIIGFTTSTLLRSKTTQYLKNFTLIPSLHTYLESAERVYGGKTKQPHGVLLLHGYSTSPQVFDALYPLLQKADLPYYAPQLTGFGLSDMRLLGAVQTEDWLRDAINAYDLMAAFFEKVSIVGLSHGGSLALYIAERRPVENLILIGPYLVPNSVDQPYKTILSIPVLSQILQLAYPIYQKPERSVKKASPSSQYNELESEEFYYPTMPTSSLKALWGTQGKIDVAKARFKKMVVLYGTDDKTSDMPAALRLFDDAHIDYSSIAYPKVHHNVLWGASSDKAAQAILRVLQNKS